MNLHLPKPPASLFIIFITSYLFIDESLAASSPPTNQHQSIHVQIDGHKRLALTKEAYIGVNVEYFPDTFHVLEDPKVRYLMSQLTPSLLRIGGNSADATIYNVSSFGAAGISDNECGVIQPICLQPSQIHSLWNFTQAINWGIILNLNEWYPYQPDPVVDPNQGSRQPRPGPYVGSNNDALLRYLVQQGLRPDYITLGNELTDNLSPHQVARDYANLAQSMERIWPMNENRPRLMGPDCFWQNESWATSFLTNPILPELEAFSWHLYLLNRTAEIERILDPDILDTAALWAQIYANVLFNASQTSTSPAFMESYITETGVAWGGELNGTADRFIGAFWWLDQLAQLATVGVKAQHRHTIHAYTEGWASSFLGTVEENYTPRPDYWISLLWGRLVGQYVLRVSKSITNQEDDEGGEDHEKEDRGQEKHQQQHHVQKEEERRRHKQKLAIASSDSSSKYLRIYAHCSTSSSSHLSTSSSSSASSSSLKTKKGGGKDDSSKNGNGHDNEEEDDISRGITLIVVNLSQNITYEVTPEGLEGDLDYQELYLLSAPALDSKDLYLNGAEQPLQVTDRLSSLSTPTSSISTADKERVYTISEITPLINTKASFEVPPLTYGFVVLSNASCSACQTEHGPMGEGKRSRRRRKRGLRRL